MQATVRDTDKIVEVTEPTIDNVRSVYSGAHGCMCGCIGKHRYNPAFIDEASAARGYAVQEDEVSARSIKTVITKLKKAGAMVDNGDKNSYVFAETATRIYVVYFANSTK